MPVECLRANRTWPVGDCQQPPPVTVSTVEANTEAILRLAWARSLALPDLALAVAGSQAVAAPADSTGTLRILSLFDSTAVVGPEWMAQRIDGGAAAEFDLARALSALGPGARVVAHDALAYRDEYAPPGADLDDADQKPLISQDPADLAALIARCPIDDVNAAGLRGLDASFTMLDDDHRPLAAAAYRIEHGLIADVRPLTDPALRRQGLAAILTELIVEDALDSGLIPQLRHHHASIAGARLASALGFTPSGALIVIAAGESR